MDWNQSSAAPLTPKETLSRVSRMSWSTVSNAADRSSKARTDRQVTVVDDCVQNVRQYFQHGRLRGVVSPICGLQAWQKVCRGQVAVELSENDAPKKLGDNR